MIAEMFATTFVGWVPGGGVGSPRPAALSMSACVEAFCDACRDASTCESSYPPHKHDTDAIPSEGSLEET